jgi:hypothetical protein
MPLDILSTDVQTMNLIIALEKKINFKN